MIHEVKSAVIRSLAETYVGCMVRTPEEHLLPKVAIPTRICRATAIGNAGLELTQILSFTQEPLHDGQTGGQHPVRMEVDSHASVLTNTCHNRSHLDC
jgi:hypothetical protein